MKIALATPNLQESIAACLDTAAQMIASAAADGACIICFPESYIPGYPLNGRQGTQPTAAELEIALGEVCSLGAKYGIAVIMPMDWHTQQGLENVAFVISGAGEILGYQSKNQLDPSEDELWIPGAGRRIFETGGLRFGISICHEGFRYPETVRWAARNGAQIVFHPNCTGSDTEGVVPAEWGSKDSPYYEKATAARALENSIYFASANYCFTYPHSASAIVTPDGALLGWQPYCVPGVLIADIHLAEATGLLASRFKPELLAAI